MTDLSIDAGTGGAVIFSGVDVDGLVSLNSLTLSDASSVSIAGNMLVNNLVTANKAYTVSLTGNENLFDNAVNFQNTGTVTLGDIGANTFRFSNGLSFGNDAASQIGADLTADNGATINFGAGGVTLIAASTVDTTDGGGFADGAAITFGDQVVGGFDLGLTAGGVGEINFTGADDAITLNNLTLTSADSSTIAGNLAVNDLITTANVGDVTMTGATNTFDAEVDFINSGTTTFGDGGGSVFTFNDGLLFSTNTASVLNEATIQSSGDQVDFGAR